MGEGLTGADGRGAARPLFRVRIPAGADGATGGDPQGLIGRPAGDGGRGKGRECGLWGEASFAVLAVEDHQDEYQQHLRTPGR